MLVNAQWTTVAVLAAEPSSALVARIEALLLENLNVALYADFDLNQDLQIHQNLVTLKAEKFPSVLSNMLSNGQSQDKGQDNGQDGGFDLDFDAVFLFGYDEQDAVAQEVHAQCVQSRLPVNVHNVPALSSFTCPAVYAQGPLSISISTSLRGCKMASRIKREIIKALPSNIGDVVTNVGMLRDLLKQQHNVQGNKWLSQIIDYYPLSKLDELSLEDLDETLAALQEQKSADGSASPAPGVRRAGKISLIGSGPGSISNLTLGAINAIYEADLVLADKLVPEEILKLIPQSTQVFIARKFPGNADKAQQELLDMGLQALQQGKNVLRLKQGDPYIFGRGGEEWLWFNQHGYQVEVLSGLTSAFVACARAGIPTTHRGVADQVLICTGVGKAGQIPDNLPLFEAKRTVIFLMSIKRIVDILPILINEKHWPRDLPVKIVERASCGDERVISTKLGDLVEVCDQVESRPPGLIVTGYACDVYGKLDEGKLFDVMENGQVANDGTDLTKIVGYLSKTNWSRAFVCSLFINELIK